MVATTYPNVSSRYRQALVELKFRADVGVPSIYCPASGRLILPAANSADSLEEYDTAYWDRLPTVLFLYSHEAGEFMYLRDQVAEEIERQRTQVGVDDEASDFDVLTEHTPDLGGGFLVLDITDWAPGGHSQCVTIGLDLARKVQSDA